MVDPNEVVVHSNCILIIDFLVINKERFELTAPITRLELIKYIVIELYKYRNDGKFNVNMDEDIEYLEENLADEIDYLFFTKIEYDEGNNEIKAKLMYIS